jgi:hypothetical protein
VALYDEAYDYFFLSLRRFLPAMSLGLRWRNTAYWSWRAHRRYTPAERLLTRQYAAVERFLHYDFWNCLLHSRILCDRAIALSRPLFRGGELPSFTSFFDHKKFWLKDNPLGTAFPEYQAYFRNETSWFDIPLRYVRDKYLVHALTNHGRHFGYADPSGDLQLLLTIPTGFADGHMAGNRHVTVSIRRLARDIRGFLAWLDHFGRTHLPAAA